MKNRNIVSIILVVTLLLLGATSGLFDHVSEIKPAFALLGISIFGMSLFGCFDTPPRSCDDCTEDERRKIVHVAFIKKGTVIDKSTPVLLSSTLKAAELLCNAIIIRNVSGEYDGGTFTEGPGPGKQITRINGGTHQIVFTDFNYIKNVAFWNGFKRVSQNYYMIYFTDTYAWLVTEPVTVLPKPAFDRDNQAYIEADITVKWSSADNPQNYKADVDALSECQALFDIEDTTGLEPVSGNQATISGLDVTVDSGDNINIMVDTGVDLSTVEVISENKPAGLTVDTSLSDIRLYGSVAAAGVYPLTIRASNACGVSGEFTVTLIVE